MMPKLVVLQSWKKLQVLEKKIFRKKKPSSIFVQIRPTKWCPDIFLKQTDHEIFNFRWFFGSEKTVLHHKILNKTWSTKNQKNPAHRFGGNYFTNHLVKFLQDKIKSCWVGALRVFSGYHVLKWKSLVNAEPPLTPRMVYINPLNANPTK